MTVMDPGSFELFKTAAAKVGGAAVKQAKHAWQRRRAEDAPRELVRGISTVVLEALDDLVGEHKATAILRRADAAFSRPASVDKPFVRDWLRRADVRDALVAFFELDFSGKETEETTRALHAAYEEVSGEVWQLGLAIIHDVLDFVARTIVLADGPAGQSVLLDSIRGVGRSTNRNGEKLDRIERQLQARVPSDLIDHEIERELLRFDARRGFAAFDAIADARRLISMLDGSIDGALAGGTAATKAKVISRCARTIASIGQVAEAEAAIAMARREQHDIDVSLAEAWIAARRPDATSADGLRRLRGDARPDARTTALLIVRILDGEEKAREWVERSSYEAAQAEGLGLMTLVQLAITEGDLNKARVLTRIATPAMIARYPRLWCDRAILALDNLFAVSVGPLILNGVPFMPVYEFAAGPRGEAEQRDAVREDLRAAHEAVKNIGAHDAARHIAMVSTWLDLLDESTAEDARSRVSSEMEVGDEAVHWCQLALPFRIPFDRSALECHLAKARIDGGWTPQEVCAAFTLAYRDPDPNVLLRFLADHRGAVDNALMRSQVTNFEIAKLAELGRIADAKALLEQEREDLGQEIYGSLSTRLAAIATRKPFPLLERRYKESKSVEDLEYLVRNAASRRDHKIVARYAESWFEACPSVEAAEMLTASWSRTGRGPAVLSFLEKRPSLVAGSQELLEVRAWHRFYAGRLDEAMGDVTLLRAQRDNVEDVSLAVTLAVESGVCFGVQV